MAINLGIALYTLGQYIFVVRNDGEGLGGDLVCYGVYYAAAVMYKPFSLNMMWLLTNCIMYAFADRFYDKSGQEAHQRDALGTPVTLDLQSNVNPPIHRPPPRLHPALPSTWPPCHETALRCR